MTQPSVLIITNVHDVLLQYLKDCGYALHFEPQICNETIKNTIGKYEGIVTSTKIKFTPQLLDLATNLRWIARMGSGMEHIDLEYAKSKNILCVSSPEGNANAVAEQGLGMYLALQHKLLKSHLELKNDIWLRDENRGDEIENTVAGIIGVGNNGERFARKLAAVGVTVLGYDKYRKGYGCNAIAECESLEEIYEKATMISFHVPYNAETHHYFDNVFLQKMQRPFTLLNLSRGEVVSQEVLYEGMQSGKIKSAALDVWEHEPLPNMRPEMLETAKKLLAMPNFIGTAHIGGYTHEATYKMSAILKQKLQLGFGN